MTAALIQTFCLSRVRLEFFTVQRTRVLLKVVEEYAELLKHCHSKHGGSESAQTPLVFAVLNYNHDPGAPASVAMIREQATPCGGFQQRGKACRKCRCVFIP